MWQAALRWPSKLFELAARTHSALLLSSQIRFRLKLQATWWPSQLPELAARPHLKLHGLWSLQPPHMLR
jgi:hypothetical protein